MKPDAVEALLWLAKEEVDRLAPDEPCAVEVAAAPELDRGCNVNSKHRRI